MQVGEAGAPLNPDSGTNRATVMALPIRGQAAGSQRGSTVLKRHARGDIQHILGMGHGIKAKPSSFPTLLCEVACPGSVIPWTVLIRS